MNGPDSVAAVPRLTLASLGRLLISSLCLGMIATQPTRAADPGRNEGFKWTGDFFDYPYRPAVQTRPVVQLVNQDYLPAQRNRSAIRKPLTIAGKVYEHGVGVHADSFIRIKSEKPLSTFSAWIGVDDCTGGRGNVIFTVCADGREIYRSSPVLGGAPAVHVDLPLNGASLLELRVVNHFENPMMNSVDWSEAAIRNVDGEYFRLDQLQWGDIADLPSAYPFSFTYGGKSSNALLPGWRHERKSVRVTADEEQITETWSEPNGPLTVRMEAKRYRDYPAVEWLLYFENRGDRDTAIIASINSMDSVIGPGLPTPAKRYFRLTKTDGDRTQPGQFMASALEVQAGEQQALSAGSFGRSSQKDLPFYKVDYDGGSMIVAVGWTGEWRSVIETPDGSHLHLQAGVKRTHFLLHPQESVRVARMLVLNWQGDSEEANAQFRALMYKYYVRPLAGTKMLPRIWALSIWAGLPINSVTADQLTEAIDAYAKIKGVQAFAVDCGWYQGGYKQGDGNYLLLDPKRFPGGMAPVAAEAQRVGLKFGIWFDVEMNTKGTALLQAHPEWFLSSGPVENLRLDQDFNPNQDPNQFLAPDRYLLNFGLPAARRAQLAVVEHYLDMPGFGFYRQDFNGQPYIYWSNHDTPDRQGITEIKYIMGLYEYWEALAQKYPDDQLEDCSSGGKRIDLETIMHCHTVQKSDLSGNCEANQSALMGLSQYVPNCFTSGPLMTMDDYAFYSSMPASIVLGWHAYAPNFDFARANALVARFDRIRDLLVGAWYPLLPQTLDKTLWVGSEFYRPDLGRGIFLAFRRENSPYTVVRVKPRGLDADAEYEVVAETSHAIRKLTGRALMDGFDIDLEKPRSAEMFVFTKVQ